MATILAAPPDELADAVDQIVILHDVSWEDYRRVLAMRGDHSAPRISYLDGELEIRSPSHFHEGIKKTIARLVEVFAMETGLVLEGFGSWTIKKARRKRGVEPDECYTLGALGKRTAPDLAIEVIWTSGGLDKLEIYRGLGVREVWIWHKGAIEIHALRGKRYERIPRSELIPELDLDVLVSCLDRPTQTEAVRAYQALLRAR